MQFRTCMVRIRDRLPDPNRFFEQLFARFVSGYISGLATPRIMCPGELPGVIPGRII
jgi:hypothetical protein